MNEKKIEAIAADTPLDPSKRYELRVKVEVREHVGDGTVPFHSAELLWPSANMTLVSLAQTELTNGLQRMNATGAARLAGKGK